MRLLGLDERDPYGVRPHTGAANMAWDDALLQGRHPATLRLYRWEPHAVSLGYFQEAGDPAFTDLPGGVGLVRRQTGGGAIWHGEELTFSLAVDSELLPHELLDSYRLIHGAVARALSQVGCETAVAPGGKAPRPRHSDPWCFAEIACGDLLLPGSGDAPPRKLVGSAQRRLRIDPTAAGVSRVLHHGSIPLTAPPRPAGGCGVWDGLGPVAGDAPAPGLCRDLVQHLTRELGTAFGGQAHPGTPDAAEAALAAQLEEQRYGQDRFTRRR